MKNYLLLLSLLTFCVTFSQTQIGQDIDGMSAYETFGSRVSMSNDGSIVAVTAPGNFEIGVGSGQARVYKNISGTWTQLGEDINGTGDYDGLGYSVAISGDGNVLAIGSVNGILTKGKVNVYENIAGTWVQLGQTLEGVNDYDSFGINVLLSDDGSKLAVSIPNSAQNTSSYGAVRVYENLAGTWTQIGADIVSEFTTDNFASTISFSSNGDIIAIGASLNSDNGADSGQVKVYQNIAGTWTQMGQDIDGEAAGDFSGFGLDLSSDGTIVAIGATRNEGDDQVINLGHTRVFEYVNGVWTQVGQDIDGTTMNGYAGERLSISGDGSVLAIGEPGNDANGEAAGQIRIYKNMSGVWTQIGENINGEAAGNIYGSSAGNIILSPDGNTLAIGTPENSGNGVSSGHVRVFNLTQLLNVNDFETDTFVIYPNPVSEILNIVLKENLELVKFNFYNTLGQLIKSANTNTINVKDLSSGSYIVEAITSRRKSKRSIIIKH